jgi:hypothetical protein
MSYIVPREKPKCYNCPFRTLDYCGLLIEHDCVTVNVNEMTVSKYCPLFEIPTPHGRLIDADKLKDRLVLHGNSPEQAQLYANICEWIDLQETVIEAEGSEE